MGSWVEGQEPEVEWAFGPFLRYWSFASANDLPPSQPADGAGKAGPIAPTSQPFSDPARGWGRELEGGGGGQLHRLSACGSPWHPLKMTFSEVF